MEKPTFTTAAEIPVDFKGELKTPFGTVDVDQVEQGVGTRKLTAIYSTDFEDRVEYLTGTTPVNYRGF